PRIQGQHRCRVRADRGEGALPSPLHLAPTPSPGAGRTSVMRTILVVDDEPKIVRIARDYLERAGFNVITAGDGRSVLAMVRSAKPDLIVLDLALPEMDGLDVTRGLRKESEVPIIMLTTRDDEADRLVGLEL